MLSISPPIAGTGQGEYYLNLAREDYYTNGGERPGRWWGKSASALDLNGEVNAARLKNLMYGFAPDGKRPLVQNAGALDRQSAWDLTFSAPKSVSVLWSQSDKKVRSIIEEAHRKAVTGALSYLEENATYTRRGKGGAYHEKASLIAAMFEHSTSRALEPQLHTHALVLNVCVRKDGSTGTVESRPLYTNKMTAGALYRAELAKELKRHLRLELRRKNNWFEIKGISDEILEHFSTRRKQIEEELERLGLTGAKASSIATLSTRTAKQEVSREVLFTKWQKEAKELGYISPAIKPSSEIEQEIPVEDLTDLALSRATENNSHFSSAQFIRLLAEESQITGRGIDEVLSAAENVLNGSDVVPLQDTAHDRLYSTQEMIELEKKLLQLAAERQKEPFYTPDFRSDGPFANGLTEEQRIALEHIVSHAGRVKVISGIAGSGKSYLLNAAHSIWSSGDFSVAGAALSGKAAQELEEATKIPSDTLHSCLLKLEKRQLSSDILVIDEAGMIGTGMMERLIRLTDEQNTKLILVGDSRQLQAIGAGGAFKKLGDELGKVELTKIYRQEDNWAKKAVRDVIKGDIGEVLAEFKERDLLHVSSDRLQTIRDLISVWTKEGCAEPSKNVILAAEKSDIWKLNVMAQRERKARNLLGEDSITALDENFHEGDRVLFTRNSKNYGVKNGQIGTVKEVYSPERILTVTLDDGRCTSINLEKYPHIQLGYALTTHKAQGMTVDNSYVLLGGMMQDRELSYVQISRAKKKTRLFIDELEAGKEFSDIHRSMERSRQKEMAISLL